MPVPGNLPDRIFRRSAESAPPGTRGNAEGRRRVSGFGGAEFRVLRMEGANPCGGGAPAVFRTAEELISRIGGQIRRFAIRSERQSADPPGGVDRSGRTCVSNTDLLSDVGSSAAESNGTTPAPKKTVGGLTGKTVAELRSLAGELGVGETTGMRKGDLIAAIRERQGKSRKRAANETLPLEGVGEPVVKAPKREPKAQAPSAPAETKPEPKAEAPVASAPAVDAPPQAERPQQDKQDGQQSQDGQPEEGGRGRRRRGSNRAPGAPDSPGGGGRQSGGARPRSPRQQ